MIPQAPPGLAAILADTFFPAIQIAPGPPQRGSDAGTIGGNA
ncbi:hypothetical protein ISE1_1185 [plant metagenome]|uniref:Uncharacterized protein n=1 Tax=plant metagenome TaxID=1297885 RepID=A0A484VDU9_9ZZZZ